MRGKDSRREGRVRAWTRHRSERKRLKRQRKLEREARPADSDPSGAWARQRGGGFPGSGG
jgi:hypothetical protein